MILQDCIWVTFLSQICKGEVGPCCTLQIIITSLFIITPKHVKLEYKNEFLQERTEVFYLITQSFPNIIHHWL